MIHFSLLCRTCIYYHMLDKTTNCFWVIANRDTYILPRHWQTLKGFGKNLSSMNEIKIETIFVIHWKFLIFSLSISDWWWSMPLLHKKSFKRSSPPSGLQPDDKVFYCELTNEVFTDYEWVFRVLITEKPKQMNNELFKNIIFLWFC